MKPRLWEYPHISSYSALLLLAYALAWILARRQAKGVQIPGRHIDNIALTLLVFGLLGARLFSRWFYMPDVKFWESFKVWEGGGMVFYGGAILGLASVLVYGLAAKVKIGRMADCMAAPLALGLAVGRIGCFMAGCCWGDVCAPPTQLAVVDDPIRMEQIQTWPLISSTPHFLAVRFPEGSKPHRQHSALGLIEPGSKSSLAVHPAQLYEAAAALLMAWVFRVRRASASGGGLLFVRMAMAYGVVRFLIEYLRADTHPAFLGMSLSQVVSLLIVVAAGVMIFVGRRRQGFAIPVEEVRSTEALVER